MSEIAARRTSGFLDIDGARLEVLTIGPAPDVAPTIVLLHEGLGSARLWGDFPEKLAQATGLGVVAWSRVGYGRSSPVRRPRPMSYLRDEAVGPLPRVLDAIGFRRGILLGHSDGASIAAVYAGRIDDPRVAGLVLIAPHVFTEEVGLSAIAAAGEAYRSGNLRDKLARHHDDVDGAFLGWNDAWLDPAFRGLDLTAELAAIRQPVLAIQGEDDPYGTARQVETIAQTCRAPVALMLLPKIGHAPHREAPAAVLSGVATFVSGLMPDVERRCGSAKS